VLSIVYGN